MGKVSQQAREALEQYLKGINQGGHPPLSPKEIQQVYNAILKRYENEQRQSP
jgi:predicted RNase H-like HicB family nuclease